MNPINGQNPLTNFSISKLTPDDGLSQGSNYFRFEDSRGFMWITSNDALNRFDGKMVKVYNTDNYFSNCPNLQQGYGFAEDDKSNIYIGSIRGLYIYNRNQDKFHLKKIFKNGSDDNAMPICFRNGKIWCFNKQYQLATYDVKTKKVALVAQFSIPAMPSIHIYELTQNVFYNRFPFIDNNNTIWMVGYRQIETYNIKSKSIKKIETNTNSEFYSSYYISNENRILIGTDNGILDFNLNTNAIKKITELYNTKLGIIRNITASNNSIAFSNYLDLIFTTKNFDQVKWINGPSKLSYNRVYQFSFDKSQRLWMCDDGQGQLIFDFHPKILNKFPDENAPSSFLKTAGVTSFLELPNRNIIIQGRVLFDKKTNSFSNTNLVFIDSVSIRVCKDNNRKGHWIYEDYIPYNRTCKSIYFLDENQKFKKVFEIKFPNKYGIQQDMQIVSNLKILCSFPKGLYWLEPENKRLVKVVGLSKLNPFTLNLLSNNRIAVSYLNGSMLLVKVLPNNSFQIIKEVLPGIQSFYIQEDTFRNQYWVGTNQGIFLLDKNFRILKKFDANNGLAGTYIYGVLLDDNGNCFCSHQRGLSSINATNFQIVNFDKSDGIQDWDFNNRSFYKASDGILYFGGISGFNYFKPPLKPYSYYKPEVYIDQILVNNKKYAPNINANNIAKIELNYNQNNLSIKAIVKDLMNAKNRQLIYRIEEIDKKWKYVPNGSEIDFNNLAPNNYTLQLGTYDKYSNKEMHQKTILISILSPFYYKIWFWILIVFALTGVVFWWYHQRKLQRHKTFFKQQLALEQQRRKITADLHDDIGATLSSLQINSAVANQLLPINPSEAQKVLSKIEDQSQNLADKIGDIIWSMKSEQNEFMSMSTRIKNFANDILGSTEIKYAIKIEPVLDTLIKDFSYRKNIVLLIKEAINNVAKYSKANQLDVKLTLINFNLQIEIIDDGVGFEINKLPGNGIPNMQKRVEELKGNFKITSNLKEGTTILVNIPLVP